MVPGVVIFEFDLAPVVKVEVEIGAAGETADFSRQSPCTAPLTSSFNASPIASWKAGRDRTCRGSPAEKLKLLGPWLRVMVVIGHKKDRHAQEVDRGVPRLDILAGDEGELLRADFLEGMLIVLGGETGMRRRRATRVPLVVSSTWTPLPVAEKRLPGPCGNGPESIWRVRKFVAQLRAGPDLIVLQQANVALGRGCSARLVLPEIRSAMSTALGSWFRGHVGDDDVVGDGEIPVGNVLLEGRVCGELDDHRAVGAQGDRLLAAHQKKGEPQHEDGKWRCAILSMKRAQLSKRVSSRTSGDLPVTSEPEPRRGRAALARELQHGKMRESRTV